MGFASLGLQRAQAVCATLGPRNTFAVTLSERLVTVLPFLHQLRALSRFWAVVVLNPIAIRTWIATHAPVFLLLVYFRLEARSAVVVLLGLAVLAASATRQRLNRRAPVVVVFIKAMARRLAGLARVLGLAAV